MMSLTTTQRNPEISIKNQKKRVTMIKHVVGKVRTQPDPIPNITFGIPNKIDQEGAGNVIQSWAQSQPTLGTSSSNNMMFRHFPATNRKALQNGCLDARSQREFALKNPVMKSLTKTSSQNHNASTNNGIDNINHLHETDKAQPQSIMNSNHCNPASSESEHVFGIRSIANDVPIQELLKCRRGDFEESDYPDRSHMQKKGRLPPAKSTNASRLLEASIQKNYNAPYEDKIEKNLFKMKRFLKVESTVKKILQQ